MSDKVKLPKEVAEAMDAVTKHADREILFDIAYMKQVCDYGQWDEPKLAPIYNWYLQNKEMYFLALVNDYEVEQSKEDKVREVISSFCNGTAVSNWVVEEIKKIYEGDA